MKRKTHHLQAGDDGSIDKSEFPFRIKVFFMFPKILNSNFFFMIPKILNWKFHNQKKKKHHNEKKIMPPASKR